MSILIAFNGSTQSETLPHLAAQIAYYDGEQPAILAAIVCREDQQSTQGDEFHGKAQNTLAV